MQSNVRKQLKENEYEKFGALFRCSNTTKLTSELIDVLKTTLSIDQVGKANDIAAKISETFSDHLKEIEVQIDFYESPHAEGYKRAKEINNERLQIEEDLEGILKTFEQIRNRSDRYKSEIKKIGHNIETSEENRKNYPLYPPPSFIEKKDMDVLKDMFEKFLHWKVFLSSDNNTDPNVGNPYLYLDLTSKVGAGGLDVTAQNHNKVLTKKLAPILLQTGMSIRKRAIIIWAHQYYVSQLYYWRFEHAKNVFIPSLSALIKDIDGKSED